MVGKHWVLIDLLLFCTNVTVVYAFIGYITICEGQSGTISCSQGFITILSASYGRHNFQTCPRFGFQTTNCHTTKSLQLLQDKCDHMAECDIEATNDEFEDDPCPGTYKYLNATYTCVIDSTTETTSIQTEIATRIITSESHNGTKAHTASNTDDVLVITMPTVAIVMLLLILTALLLLRKRGQLNFYRDAKEPDRFVANAASEKSVYENSSGDADAEHSSDIYYNGLQSGNSCKSDTNGGKNKQINFKQGANMEEISRGDNNKNNHYELAMPSGSFVSSEYETTDHMIYTETTSGQYDCLGGNDLRRNNTNNDHLYDHTVNVSNSKDNINIYDKSCNMKSDTDPEGTYNHTNFRKC